MTKTEMLQVPLAQVIDYVRENLKQIEMR